jgi:hypothetical protein
MTSVVIPSEQSASDATRDLHAALYRSSIALLGAPFSVRSFRLALFGSLFSARPFSHPPFSSRLTVP